MAFETKGMESRFHAELNLGAAAAMTIDAVVEPSAIGKIMMASQTIDGCVLAVIKVQRQCVSAAKQGFAQLSEAVARDKRNERKGCHSSDADDESGMATEH